MKKNVLYTQHCYTTEGKYVREHRLLERSSLVLPKHMYRRVMQGNWVFFNYFRNFMYKKSNIASEGDHGWHTSLQFVQIKFHTNNVESLQSSTCYFGCRYWSVHDTIIATDSEMLWAKEWNDGLPSLSEKHYPFLNTLFLCITRSSLL